ncbi:MAG TPA: hypothetical protein VFF73_36840 [Planctomycetota bacterium]|nr:hypothetical protein [Planctomycetota bacterium]
MRLCLQCALVGRHEVGCPDDLDRALPRAERVARGMQSVKAALGAAERATGDNPREGLRLAWVAQEELDLLPVADFETYDAKRSRNDIATAIAAVRSRAASALGEEKAQELLDDLAFARRAFELFGDVARRRHEAVTFDLSEFVELPPSDRREVGEALRELCGEVEKSLAQSRKLEEDVASWGPENVHALAANEDPTAMPPGKIPPLEGSKRFFLGVVLVVLGLALAVLVFTPVAPALAPLIAKTGLPVWLPGGLAGVALAVMGVFTARAGVRRVRETERARQEAPAIALKSFHELSVAYRQRVYMSAALRVLRQKATLVEKTEDAFRAYTTGKAAPRWKRLCGDQARDVVATFFDWDANRYPLKDAVSVAVAQALGPKGRLRPFDEMATDGWDVLLKAFLLDIFAGDDARFFDGLAPLIAEGGLEDSELERRALQVVEEWNAMVGSG